METICLRTSSFNMNVPACPPRRVCPHFHRNQKLSEVYSPPCFDSIQSSVCIITRPPYANLRGPKYCGLTNPSFVFTCHTKHQSLLCLQAAPLTYPHPPNSLENRIAKQSTGWLKLGNMLGSACAINIFPSRWLFLGIWIHKKCWGWVLPWMSLATRAVSGKRRPGINRVRLPKFATRWG